MFSRNFRKGRSIWTSALLATCLVGLLGLGARPLAQMALNLTGGVHSWISPAYVSPYATADDLLQAVAPTGGGTLVRFIPTVPPAFQFWTGSDGNGFPRNFSLAQGEGLDIVPRFTESVVLLGSHSPAPIPQDQTGLPFIPAAEIPMGGTLPGTISQGHDYLVAIPWDTTMSVAEDLRLAFPNAYVVFRREEIPGQAPAFYFWTGYLGNHPSEPNFLLDPREAYGVRPSANGSPTVLP